MMSAIRRFKEIVQAVAIDIFILPSLAIAHLSRPLVRSILKLPMVSFNNIGLEADYSMPDGDKNCYKIGAAKNSRREVSNVTGILQNI